MGQSHGACLRAVCANFQSSMGRDELNTGCVLRLHGSRSLATQGMFEGCVRGFFSVAWSMYFFYPRIFKSEVGILTVCVVLNKWELSCDLRN